MSNRLHRRRLPVRQLRHAPASHPAHASESGVGWRSPPVTSPTRPRSASISPAIKPMECVRFSYGDVAQWQAASTSAGGTACGSDVKLSTSFNFCTSTGRAAIGWQCRSPSRFSPVWRSRPKRILSWTPLPSKKKGFHTKGIAGRDAPATSPVARGHSLLIGAARSGVSITCARASAFDSASPPSRAR